MKKLYCLRLGVCLLFVFAANIAFAGENTAKHSKKVQVPVKIKVSAWGPTQADVQAAKFLAEKAVQNILRNSKYRLISFGYLESRNDKSKPAQPPTAFQVIFYDYTNDRTFVAEGSFAGTKIISVREEKFQPGVSAQELADSFEVVKSDAYLGELYKQKQLEIFEAMPPISILNGARLVNVGIKILPDGENQVIGISFKNNTIVRYKDNAPLTSLSAPESCGISSGNQGETANGTAGQYQLTVSQNNAPLWEMLVIRPSASSGNSEERSGIEVRDVKYKGKSVLKRGHAPILNVQYDGNACGPFRDWQYAEGYFNAPADGATDPVPGIRILAPGQIALTALDSGTDVGNFAGVAVYTQNNETVLVSEMDAGWYRYITEWRFAGDGTIRPRYGFGSTNSSCVCYTHHHNVYWRFDFDIVSPNNKIFKIERGRKFMQPVTNEVAPLRSYQSNRSFLIQNSNGDEAYKIVPNISDGEANDFGAGDFWLLKYHAGTEGEPDEIDDPNPDEKANLTPWLNNESLTNQDIVVWYSAHFTHHSDGESLLNPDRSGNVLSGSHIVGPDLRPVHW